MDRRKWENCAPTRTRRIHLPRSLPAYEFLFMCVWEWLLLTLEPPATHVLTPPFAFQSIHSLCITLHCNEQRCILTNASPLNSSRSNSTICLCRCFFQNWPVRLILIISSLAHGQGLYLCFVHALLNEEHGRQTQCLLIRLNIEDMWPSMLSWRLESS